MTRSRVSPRGRAGGWICSVAAGAGLALLGAAGCIATLQQGLTKRAAYELRCPAEQLTLTELGAATYGVDGCGRRAVYVGAGPAGVWKLDSLTDQDGTTRTALAGAVPSRGVQ